MGRTAARNNGGSHNEVIEPRDARVDVAPEEETGLNLKALKEKKIGELAQIARDFNVEGASSMRKQDLIFAILQAQAEQSGFIYGEGVLEILSDGFGFLRSPDYNYLPWS
jgi:transcription termination factor Rho